MGQAFRRAAGRIRSTAAAQPSPPPSPPPSRLKKPLEVRQPPPPPPLEKLNADNVASAPESGGKGNGANVLEDKDPQFDAMLSQMAGRIQTKPGGKLEMGEASVVERYDTRPLPKLRNTTPDTGRYEERPAPPGTLNVAKLRHILLLYQGKADDHTGRMEVHEIAARFKIEVSQVQQILQSVSLPPDNSSKTKDDEF